MLCVIQDTIGYSPTANFRMCKAIIWAMVVVTVFYMTVGFLGYALFGASDFVPWLLVDRLVQINPLWLLDIVLVCLLLMVCGLYQVSKLCNTACMHRQASFHMHPVNLHYILHAKAHCTEICCLEHSVNKEHCVCTS